MVIAWLFVLTCLFKMLQLSSKVPVILGLCIELRYYSSITYHKRYYQLVKNHINLLQNMHGLRLQCRLKLFNNRLLICFLLLQFINIIVILSVEGFLVFQMLCFHFLRNTAGMNFCPDDIGQSKRYPNLDNSISVKVR